MSTELSSRQRAKLRGMAMSIKTQVHIGRSGLTASIIREISSALDRDELIKVGVVADDRNERAAIMEQIATETGACLCGATGTKASYYRQSKEKRINID